MAFDNHSRGHLYTSANSSGSSVQHNGDSGSTTTGDTNLSNFGDRSSIQSGDHHNGYVARDSITTHVVNSTHHSFYGSQRECACSGITQRQHLEKQVIDAATEGDSVELPYLLNSNLQLRPKERWGDRALQGAIKGKHLKCVEILLKRGVSREKEDENGLRPLMVAAEYGFEAVVKALLDKNADVAATTTAEKWTALMLAAAFNRLTVVNLLLAAGVDFEVGDLHNRTALMQAASQGHAAVVEALLNAGAKIDRRDRPGKSALMFAAEKNQHAVVRLLLQRGAHINAVTNLQETALLIAVCHCHRDMAQLLLEEGADVDASNQYGQTAMSLAAYDMVHLIKTWKARRMQTPAPSLEPPTLDISEAQVSPATLPPESSILNTTNHITTDH